MLANLAQQIPNFTSKVITRTITILNIHNHVQKVNEEKRKRKERRVGKIIPS